MSDVCVLMSTYNGEKYLREQLDSILSQEKVNVRLLIRDDGSTDNTVKILKEYVPDSRITLYTGENIGYKKSFYWLLDIAPDADYFAFADQDDIWLSDKLYSAVELIETESKNTPLLYTSALTCVNEKLEFLRPQNFVKLRLDFYSEFVRHRFAGCTYVFNNVLRNKCRGISRLDSLNYGHDGLIALLCWVTGGKVIYDAKSHILFRRHGNNASADGGGLKRRIKNELAPFLIKRNYKLSVAEVLLSNFDCSAVPAFNDFLADVCGYKRSLLKSGRILFSRECDCGIFIGNFMFKMSVLFRVL